MLGRLTPGAWRWRYHLGLWGRAAALLGVIVFTWFAAVALQGTICP